MVPSLRHRHVLQSAFQVSPACRIFSPSRHVTVVVRDGSPTRPAVVGVAMPDGESLAGVTGAEGAEGVEGAEGAAEAGGAPATPPSVEPEAFRASLPSGGTGVGPFSFAEFPPAAPPSGVGAAKLGGLGADGGGGSPTEGQALSTRQQIPIRRTDRILTLAASSMGSA